MRLPVKESDAVVIGTGGAGVRAMLQISQNGRTCAPFSKVFLTRSRTVSAQGGITVALGNTHEDNQEWHMYNIVKGSDYIGDQDAIEHVHKTGPEATLELNHVGLSFSCLDSGTIYRRPFGEQSKNLDGEQAARTAAAADRIGHALLHILHQQNLKNHTAIFSKWYVLDLVKNADSAVVGCTALYTEAGEVVYSKACATVLATGGAGHIYQSTTNTHISTGNGAGMAIHIGMSVQGVEMWQFHPADVAGADVLATEGCRDESSYLLNKHGERFMERYTPDAKDPAGRDVMARSIMIEIREGRGCDSLWGPHVELKLDHLGKGVLEPRLPGVLKPLRTPAHVDPVKEPVPVILTCYRTMGGIPTKVTGQTLAMNEQGEDVVIPGLFAVGEIACASVHGANRLNGNSPPDLVVFGYAVGLYLQGSIAEQDDPLDATEDEIDASLARLNRWNGNRSGEGPVAICKALRECMQHSFSVFCEDDVMAKDLEELKTIRKRLRGARLDGTSGKFNTRRAECLGLGSLVETVCTTAISTNPRIEGRGAHSHFDFPERGDEDWLYHSSYLPKSESMMRCQVSMEPELHPTSPPEIRTY